MKTYKFESANKGTIEVTVTGDYRGNFCKDIDVTYCENDATFEECDDADEIMQWLVNEGVQFATPHSAAFNRAYIQQVLIDGDTTENELLDDAANWTEKDVELKLSGIEF